MQYFHKEGHTLILGFIAFSISIFSLLHIYEVQWAISLPIILFILFINVTFLQFFRNPKRNTILNPKQIIAPADGKVVVIETTEENEYFKADKIQISIFMSPTNVHVNKNPVSGIVTYFKYHPGKFLVAWHPKASTDNERTTLVVKSENGTEILIRQIAGALAKRIKWYVAENDKVTQGEEFGFIKFGSRVDLYLPIGTKINVTLNEATRGGETVIATFE